MLKSIYDTDNDGRVDAAEVADSVPWAGVSGKPTEFPPAAHKATHASGGSDPLTPADIGALVSVDGVANPGGDVDLSASDTVILQPDNAAKRIRIGTQKLPIFVQGGHLFHFDGTLMNTKGLQPLPGYVATLRPGEGRFGGAVAVEEGTTNLEDPKTWSGWMIDASVTALSTYEHELTASGTPADSAFVYKTFNFGGSALTFQVEIAGVGSTIGKRVRWQASQAGFGGTELVLTAEYQRLIATIGPLEGNVPVGIGVVEGLSAGEKVKLRYRQVEQKPFATSFVDGTRAAGALGYPLALPDNAGTVALWARKHTTAVSPRKLLDAQNPRVDFQWSSSGTLALDMGGANILVSDPAQDTNWHHYAFTYSGRQVKLFFDGQLVATGTATQDLVNFTPLTVGCRYDNTWPLNGLLDELLILPYAASVEEIRSWYEAQAPFYDPDGFWHAGNFGPVTWNQLAGL